MIEVILGICFLVVAWIAYQIGRRSVSRTTAWWMKSEIGKWVYVAVVNGYRQGSVWIDGLCVTSWNRKGRASGVGNWKGTLDDIRMYDKGLSMEQIKAIVGKGKR